MRRSRRPYLPLLKTRPQQRHLRYHLRIAARRIRPRHPRWRGRFTKRYPRLLLKANKEQATSHSKAHPRRQDLSILNIQRAERTGHNISTRRPRLHAQVQRSPSLLPRPRGPPHYQAQHSKRRQRGVCQDRAQASRLSHVSLPTPACARARGDAAAWARAGAR